MEKMIAFSYLGVKISEKKKEENENDINSKIIKVLVTASEQEDDGIQLQGK